MVMTMTMYERFESMDLMLKMTHVKLSQRHNTT
jgi:hypothetical protein